MNRFVNQLLFVLLGVFVISCQNNSGKKKVTVSPEPLVNEITIKHSAQMVEKEHPGKTVYKKYCLACHQSNGSGVPGLHPPLGSGSWIDKDPKELVDILTKGLSGKIEVNGEVYKSAMPPQPQLTDEEIADVLSYIRSDFGNNFDPVDTGLVKKIRSGK